MGRAEAKLHNTVFTMARARPEEWEQFISGLSDDEFMRVGRSLDDWIEEIDNPAEDLEIARQRLERYAKRWGERVENSRRAARTVSDRIPFREFFVVAAAGH